MPAPIVIMVGGPATGKTTLGRRIAQTFQIPYFSKDGVKEPIFDHVGCPLRWSDPGPLGGQRMDEAAVSILLYLIEEQSRAGHACVVDSTFQQKDRSRLKALRDRSLFLPVQVHCRTESTELARRYRQRAHGHERHPGHLDDQLAATFDADALREQYRPLELGGPVFPIDTTTRLEDPVQSLLKSLREYVRLGC
jgi:predicted kinase